MLLISLVVFVAVRVNALGEVLRLHDAGIDIGRFDHITTDAVGNNIGWIELFNCREGPAGDGNAAISKYNFLNGEREDIFQYAISFKIEPFTDDANRQYDPNNFRVQTKTCSNPVIALNRGKELSFRIDPTNGNYLGDGFMDPNDWYGASFRLRNTCKPQGDKPREFRDCIFHACGNVEHGLHLFQNGDKTGGMCRFDWNDNTGLGMKVYVGFARTGRRICDGNGNGGFKPLRTCYLFTSPAWLSGDPHWVTFNGVYEHFQGDVNDDAQQFYFMTSCDINDREYQPFSMIGSLHSWGTNVVTGLQYVVLELYNGDKTDYVFINTMIFKYALDDENDDIPVKYEEAQANAVAFHELNDGQVIGRFKLLIGGKGSNVISVTLRDMRSDCQVQFVMQLQGNYGAYRLHYMRVLPPACYRCSTCGLLGDFQTPWGGRSLLECDGSRYTYQGSWWPVDGFSRFGWGWQVEYVNDQCGTKMAPAPQVPVVTCEGDVEEKVVVACQRARDQQLVCCRNLGGGFCTNLQESCVDDVCFGVEEAGDHSPEKIHELVSEEFTRVVLEECTNRGQFGPVPRLLYDFQDSLEERMSGDPKYQLQHSNGHAVIENGVLKCDGNGADFVFSSENIDFPIDSHSLEVLVTIGDINQVGGGAIAIDKRYNPDGGYAHQMFDSIVYNEMNNRKWFMGSEYFRRTNTAGGNAVENTAHQYIHLIATYNVQSGDTFLYRNGRVDQANRPNGFFRAGPNEGVRMMFCQRHMNAGAQDFEGTIRYGAYYDRALTPTEVIQLYTTQVVTVHATQFEIIGDELTPDKQLTGGQALRSLNERYVAAMQYDGNFVVYDMDGQTGNEPAIWSTGTHGQGDKSWVILQGSDGNLVIYNDGGVTYATHKYSDQPSFLIMQDDGNLVVYQEDDTAYFDSKGFTAAGSGFFNLVPMNGTGIAGSLPMSTATIDYLIYIFGLLIIANIACVIFYCYREKKDKKDYKVVSMNGTDTDITDTDITDT